MSLAHEGGQRSHAPSAAVESRAAELTPTERAAQAGTVADNLARWATTVDDAHRDLTAASTPDAHAAALDRADQALASLRDLAVQAQPFVETATDAATRDRLRDASAVVLRAEAQAQTRPPAPAATAGSASPGHAAFLAALPPARGRRRQESPALIATLANVIESQLAFSDLDPLAAALVDDDAVRPRFERLSERARQQLVARLTSRTLRQRLLAEHNARQRSPAAAPPPSSTPPALSIAPDGPDPTREVASQLGAQLGVSPRISTGEAARDATEAHGADGVAHHDEIAIHPEVDPASAHGRRVIAHELVHQAQARLPADHDTGRDDAEAEAESLAAVAATGGALRAPTHAIDLSRPAGNNDARTDAPDAAAAPSSDHALTRSPGARHDVFAATGTPYLVEDRAGKPGAWVVRSWITAHGTRQGDAWIAPACARELLTAMGWIDAARIEFAASTLSFRFTRAIEYLAIGAEAAHSTGLRPGTKAIVERAPDHALDLTVALDDPSTPPGTPHELTGSEMTRAIDAAATFTQLTPTLDGVMFLMTKAARQPVVTGNGTLFFTMNRAFCRTLFGFDAFEIWWSGKLPPEKAPTPDAPKLALTNFFQRPVPGELTHYAGIIESGERTRFEVLVEWPPDAPNPEIYDAPPMVTPSKFGNVAILKCAWRFERVSTAAATGGAPSSSAPARGPDFLRSLLDQAFAPGTASADATPAPAPAAPPAKAASGAATTEIAEAFHAFKLAPGEAQATWRVTCEATCEAYFAPNTFSLDVTVQSSKAAMAGLRTEAFAGLGADDRDRDGGQWKTPLAADHVATPAAPTGGSIFTDPLGHDPASASRRLQREQLQNVRAYLATADEQNPGADHNTETLAAIDRELDRQWKTEAALANDRQNGAQPFQLRGTYLSRTEGLASGPLELHGTVRTRVATGRTTDTTVEIIDKYVVQIRDLSRRFAQEDFLFAAEGRSFALALEDAFNQLATAYPKGLVAIEAEELRGESLRRHDGSPGAPGPLGTGQAIGFQRSSETTWKQVKDVVWDPIASTVVNLGAMAIMTVAPFTAPVIAPALILYNAVPVVDNLAIHANRGTLTPRELVLSVGELALNVLPVVGTARPLGAGWYAIEAANWGGQALLLNERVKGLAHQLQTQQVAALARQYAQLLELKQRHRADNAATTRAEALLEDEVRKVNLAIHDAFTELAGQNLLYAVAATTIHTTLPTARAALLAALERRGTTLAATGAGDPPAGPATDAPLADPGAGHDSASTTARDTVTAPASLDPTAAASSPRGSAEILPPNRYKPAPKREQDLDGSAEKALLIDTQTGKKYLFKPSRPDASIPLRAVQNGITPETLAARAKASQITADALGIDTPDVRLVVHEGQYGSLQEWRKQRKTESLNDLRNASPAVFQAVTKSPEYIQFRAELDTLDFIINNLDRNPGNILVHFDDQGATTFTAIDHDLTFTESAERFEDPLGTWTHPLPDTLPPRIADRLHTLASSPDELRRKLAPLLSAQEIEGAITRLARVLTNDRIDRQPQTDTTAGPSKP